MPKLIFEGHSDDTFGELLMMATAQRATDTFELPTSLRYRATSQMDLSACNVLHASLL